MGSTIALRNVVGEDLNRFGIRIVPLHRDVDNHAVLLAEGVEYLRVQDALAAVHVLDEGLDAARERKVLALSVALIDELDLDAVVQKGQFADPPGQNVVVEFDIGERRFRRHEMHFGPATLGRAGHRQRRNRDAVPEFHLMCEAVAPNPQLEPFRQPVDHGNAHAVQPAGNLVGILIELAARMQLGHDDLGRGTLQLVVVLDVRRNSAPVVDHRDRIVGVYDYLDVVAIPGERFVDGVVQHFEYHVMQPRAIGSVADVHAGPLAHGLEAFEHLDAVGIVVAAVVDRLGIRFSHALVSLSLWPSNASTPTRSRRHRRGSHVHFVRCASASRRTCNHRDRAS